MQAIRPIVLSLALVFCSTAALGQKAAPEARAEIGGQTLFVLRSGAGEFTALDRARAVNQRFQEILRTPRRSIETSVQKTETGLLILVGSTPIVMVTDRDAQAEKVSPEVLAERWATAIKQGLQRAESEEVWHTLLRHLVLTALVLVLAVLVCLLLRRARAWQIQGLEARRERFPTLRFRGLEVLSGESLYKAAARLFWLVYVTVLLLVAFAALLLVFGQFPATQRYARQILLWIWTPLARIFWGVVGYLPSLFYILVIVVVTRFVIRGLNFVFEQAHRGVISLEPWVHRDVARPTAQILKVVMIVLALFFIAPLIPGTGTTAAQAITLLLGLTVSLGSTSTVGNAIAGIVLTYMRPFQLGDRVQIGETTGDVVERTFLYTKLLTIKNEEVMVPSLQVISRAMINYSARARHSGLILHSSVTIGYTAPWRKVHELLLQAAERTTHILKEPKPFVLQTSLDDWYVSYELNAYTDQPNRMAAIYAELHQNIQDAFNEGGVEIMSPHYYQLRDGNTTTIPHQYHDRGYEPSRFLVDARVAEAGR